jgi:hypothetical protein
MPKMSELRFELLTLPVRALFECPNTGIVGLFIYLFIYLCVYLFVAYLTTLLSYSDYMSSNEINTG